MKADTRVFAIAFMLGCQACDDTAASERTLEQQRTGHGIVHVSASDYHGLGLGVGHAFAEDNRCLLAYRLAEVQGHLAEHLGADAPVTAAVHDLTYSALQSDHYYRGWFDRAVIAAAFASGVPEVVELAEGYADGVGRAFAEHQDDPACEVPLPSQVTREDIYMIWVAAATVASGEVFAGYLPHAAPSGSATDYPVANPHAMHTMAGSNAWALGRDATQNGHSVHLYNPHFPWSGIHRLYMVHATIPGELDVMGVALGGFPLPLSGFTRNLSWGLTFSPASRWAARELVLDGDGKTYRVGGESRHVTREVLSIPVRGEAQPRRLPFFRADGDPIIHAPGFLLSFTRDKAFAVKDVNATNTRVVEQFLRVAQAGSVQALRDELGRIKGVPWSYTIAADVAGDTLFGELSPVPRIDDALLTSCGQSAAATLHLAHGFLILDGNRPECAWEGLMDASQLPHTIRSDYVANSNNNYEWPNESQRLTGYPRALGGEGKPLSLRANLGLRMVHERLQGQDARGQPGFTAEQARQIFLEERNRGAELLVDAIVDDCLRDPLVMHEGQSVDLQAVCTALGAWDRRNTPDSRGAHIFAGLWKALAEPLLLFETQASADAPLTTPSGHTRDAARREEARQALAKVALSLSAQGIAPDARWGDVHRVLGPRGAVSAPGGSEFEGIFDALTSSLSYYNYDGWIESLSGVPPATLYGGTYMHVVELTDEGPLAVGVLPYSQATEPSSPWYMDQLDAWSTGAWFKFPFSAEEIASDPALTKRTLRY